MQLSKFLCRGLAVTALTSARAENARVLSESLLGQLRAEVRSNHPSVGDAEARAQAANAAGRTIGEIIPRREKAAEAIENAWISSKAMLMEVLAARNALLMARLEVRRRIAAQHAALEKLHAHVPGADPPLRSTLA